MTIPAQRFGPFGRIQQFLSLTELSRNERGSPDNRQTTPNNNLRDVDDAEKFSNEKQSRDIVVPPAGKRMYEIEAPNKQKYRMVLSKKELAKMKSLLDKTETEDEIYEILRVFAKHPRMGAGFHDYQQDRYEPGALTRPQLSLEDHLTNEDLVTPRVSHPKGRRTMKGPLVRRKKKKRRFGESADEEKDMKKATTQQILATIDDLIPLVTDETKKAALYIAADVIEEELEDSDLSAGDEDGVDAEPAGEVSVKDSEADISERMDNVVDQVVAATGTTTEEYAAVLNASNAIAEICG